MTNTTDLRAAAQAVTDRWDTPLWKDAPATAEYISRLRAALTAPDTAAAPAQAAPHVCRLLTQQELDSLGARAEGMDGDQWDKWVQTKFAEANKLKIEGGSDDEQD